MAARTQIFAVFRMSLPADAPGVIGPETQQFHGADGEVRLANGLAQASPAVLAKS